MTIDKEAMDKAVRSVLPTNYIESITFDTSVRRDRVGAPEMTITLHECEVTFDLLKTLSEKLNTTNINLRYRESEGPWSDVTPGSTEDVSLLVWWDV
jgi:hypothetical protein